ncbi:MAG: Hsp20/alpha crystallin family protein [Leptolyngbyaceae bacterium]|nr:Hsp20/alpha crystallin family protein [Leptolyngbyaceae bacterium]
MAIVHFEAFPDIDTLHRQVHRLFDDLGFSDAVQERGLANFVPAAELAKTDEALVLRLELPGVNPEDLNVEVMAESVSIEGDRPAPHKTPEEGAVRSEFRYGKFQRVIPLPTRIQNTKAEAKYENGILTLILPKVEEEKNKVIKVAIR